MKKVSVLFATNSPLTKGMSAGRGVAKKMIIAIMLVFCATTVRAENTNISTSQYYVDTNAATRQDAAPANNANTVMTYDSTSPDGIGAKAIYDTTATYGEQKSALVTAATANAAIQNGINSEFVCANPPKCNLWNLAGLYGRVPSGYTELEYLESTGEQYINTGIRVNIDNHNMRLLVKRTTFSVGNGWKWMLDGAANLALDAVYVGINKQNRYFYGIGNDSDTSTVAIYDVPLIYDLNIPENYYHVINDNGTYLVNIQSLDANHTYYTDEGLPLYLFGYSGEHVLYWGRIYYAKIWDNSTLVRNFIPAKRNSDGTLGMYDTVTNTFFTNAGTGGDFIAGPVASYVPQNQQ